MSDKLQFLSVKLPCKVKECTEINTKIHERNAAYDVKTERRKYPKCQTRLLKLNEIYSHIVK